MSSNGHSSRYGVRLDRSLSDFPRDYPLLHDVLATPHTRRASPLLAGSSSGITSSSGNLSYPTRNFATLGSYPSRRHEDWTISSSQEGRPTYGRDLIDRTRGEPDLGEIRPLPKIASASSSRASPTLVLIQKESWIDVVAVRHVGCRLMLSTQRAFAFDEARKEPACVSRASESFLLIFRTRHIFTIARFREVVNRLQRTMR